MKRKVPIIQPGIYLLASLSITVLTLSHCTAPSNSLDRSSTKPGEVCLESPAIEFRFSPDDLSIQEIKNKITGYRLVVPDRQATRKLWEIEVIDDSGQTGVISSLDKGRKSWTRDRQGGRETLELRWYDMPTRKWEDTMDVRVTISIDPETEFTHWRISVDNHSDEFGLWKIRFPMINSIGSTVEDEDDLKIAVPYYTGWLFSGTDDFPKGIIDWEYPSTRWSMQFHSIYSMENGFYFACHDSTASYKAFQLSAIANGKGLNSSILIFPSHMGEIGRSFELSFPVVMGAYRGTWYEAAKIYRDWAIKQIWCSKGLVANRDDLPGWYKNLSLWFKHRDSKFPGRVLERTSKFKEYVGLPLALHWYIWHQIPFDDDYPNYFPPIEGFEETVADLIADQVFVFPYINGRLWDTDTGNWNLGFQGAAKNRELANYVEIYKSKQKMAPMCPHSVIWQKTIEDIVRNLIQNYRVSGIYLDQITAAPPKLCFDTDHGHPVGGGSFWVDGYRQLLSRLKEIRPPHGDAVLVSENNAEPWGDLLDGYLIWIPPSGNTIPLFQTVYSDYTTTFGRRITVEDLEDEYAFYAKEADLFVYGGVPGWVTKIILRKEHREQLDFLKHLAEMRRVAGKYLSEGELVRPIEFITAIPEVSLEENVMKKMWSVLIPVVQHSVWKAPDGSLGVIMVNTSPKSMELEYRIDMETYGFNNRSGFTVKEMSSPGSETSSDHYPGFIINRVDRIPARSVLALEVTAK
jgi:hypothetical protein